MKICPRCHEETLDGDDTMNIRSRRDNSTYICDECADEESYIDEKIIRRSKKERDFKKYLDSKRGKDA